MAVQLSTWDQIAPRNYIRQVYCFPYTASDEHHLRRLKETLSASLTHACIDLPDLGGRVGPSPNKTGHMVLSKAHDDHAILKVQDESDTFPNTYAELKARGFPASVFVGPSFDLPYRIDQGNSPVTEIHARVISGGLFLCIYVHHAVKDGIGMARFVSAFSRYTASHQDGTSQPSNGIPLVMHTDLPEQLIQASAGTSCFKSLMSQCSEYWTLPEPTGPLTFRAGSSKVPFENIPKIGKILVYPTETIRLLKGAATRALTAPSTFACVAAHTWAFSVTARVRTANVDLETVLPRICTLILPASWSRRAFPDFCQTYDGNAVVQVKVDAQFGDLLAAATCKDAAPSQALVRLVKLIETALAQVDDAYVAKRTAMIRTAPDPRYIGVNHDPLDVFDFIINSWRHLGADTQWGIPGTSTSSPDSVRRCQPAWNMSAGLVMPGKKDCGDYEMLVTLDTASMVTLCGDENLGLWVRRIVA